MEGSVTSVQYRHMSLSYVALLTLAQYLFVCSLPIDERVHSYGRVSDFSACDQHRHLSLSRLFITTQVQGEILNISIHVNTDLEKY